MTTNVSALTSVVSSTLGGPLIKVAAFSYGVRKAVGHAPMNADAVEERPPQSTGSGGSMRRLLFWLAMGMRHPGP